MSEYHESYDARPEDVRNAHCAILEHNRDEEMEHASMLVEWLRRHMDGGDHELKAYLFSEGPLTHMEEEATGE